MTRIRMCGATLVFALTAVLIPASEARANVIFDLESETATFSEPLMTSRLGAFGTLTMTVDGLTITITRPGSSFDIVSNTSGGQTGKPASFGDNSLDPFFEDTNSAPFILDFSTPISAFSVDYGDFGADFDEMLLEAFSGARATGNLLAMTTDTYGVSSFADFSTATVSAQGIRSIRMVGGSTGFPHSVFYDNLTATQQTVIVPEPSTLVLSGIALLFGITGHVRQRRKRTVVAI